MVETFSTKRAAGFAGAVLAIAGLLAGCSVADPVIAPPAHANTPSLARKDVTRPATSPSTQTPAPVFGIAEGIDSVSNFRDVAGSAEPLVLPDGGTMKPGVVFRSGKLKPMSDEDKSTLAKAGLSDIFDLRTDEVSERTPDPEIGDAELHLINLFAVPKRPSWKYQVPDDARLEREAMNREFVSDPKQRERTAVVLKGIAEAKGASIIHCTEGKDRTGWISAVLQMIAGADETQIVDEYMLSNVYRQDLIEKDVAKVTEKRGAKKAAIQKVRITVEPEFLQAGLDEMTARYGTLENYLTEGLGLDQATIDQLRQKLRTE